MKKIIAILLTLVMTFSFVACSTSKGEVYTPVFGEELSVSEKLTFKDEYKKAISKESREIVSEYLSIFAAFYNETDIEERQSVYYSYYIYMVSESVFNGLIDYAYPLQVKLNAGETLTDKEQIFLDTYNDLFDVYEILSEIDSEAYNNEEIALGLKTEGDDTTEEVVDEIEEVVDETEEIVGETEQEDVVEDTTGDDATTDEDDTEEVVSVEELTIDAQAWEELFNKLVEVMDKMFVSPFVK